MSAKTKNRPTAKKKQPQKKIVKEPTILGPDAKLRKKPIYKSFRLHRRIKHHSPALPSWRILLKKAFMLIWANKKPIFFFMILYGLLNLVLVRGLASPIDVDEIRESLINLVDGETANLAAGFTGFGLLLSASSNSLDTVAQLYQGVLLVLSSLAIIWMYRQQQAGNPVSIRESFYRGMYPLIPFLLVVFVIALQLLPAMIGNFLLKTVLDTGLAVTGYEQVIWVIFFIMTVLLSLYMITSSSIALYIVTLPEMTPMIALREARERVRYRRVSILKKVFAIIAVIFLILFVIVLPILFLAPVLAEWIFFLVTVLLVPLVHAYMFVLYRELL